MRVFLVIAGIALLVSLTCDYRKTLSGFRRGFHMFIAMFFPFMTVLIVASVFMTVVSKDTIVAWLGGTYGISGFIIAALAGSIALVPGFVAFPLGSILLRMGVSFQVIAVFLTTLMMVGIVTLPLEARYFGWKPALMRNALGFVGALLVGIAIGVLWRYI